MIKQDRINKIIFNAIDEINEGVEEDKKLGKTVSTVLYGKKSMLDSLGLVNLIVSVEEKIQDEAGVTVNLADEKALSQKNSPFLTVKTLSDYILSLLTENKNSNCK